MTARAAARSAATRAATARRGLPAAALAVIAVTLATYWPGLQAGFVGDDFMILHRLRQLSGAADVLRFFRAEFFEYYRPIGFVAHGVDWAMAGPDPRQFHLTNILLHTANAVLVLLIGRALSPRSLAGPIAALLFALHASNHEAVMWMSARFDLLATGFSLAALWWMIRRDDSRLVPAVLFALAVLSKESAVAMPLAAAAWSVFQLRSSRVETVVRIAPWLVALAACAVLRQMAGGVSAIGGSNRLPKLVVFAATLGGLVLGAGGRWLLIRQRLRERRTAFASAWLIAVALCAAGAAVSSGPIGRLAAEKLAVAGFAVFHLLSPVVDVFDAPFYLDPSTNTYWIGGLVAIALAGAAAIGLWRRAIDDDRMWFLSVLLLAALLPVSALTEGKRYLYLASAACSLIAGVLVAELRGRTRTVAVGAVCGVLIVSAVQISAKIRDWQWAGRMTNDGARMVDAALAPQCGTGHVVFLTSPVAIRGVYTHFYYETFELPRGCMPEMFQVLVRVVRLDIEAAVQWDGLGRIVLAVPRYAGNFVASHDLRHFDRPLRPGAIETIDTPLGELRAEPFGVQGERLTLTLSESMRSRPPLIFYYSAGQIHRLPFPGLP